MKRSILLLFLLTTTASGQELTYETAAARAVQQGRPLITYVGSVRHREIAGAVTCATPTLPGYASSIVVALPGLSCASCHEGGHGNAPGSGPYAGGLVPGSDGVYSFPFPALER